MAYTYLFFNYRRQSSTASVWKDPQGLAVLDDVIVDLAQRLVLVLEPFLDQLRRRQAHSRLVKQLVGAAKRKRRSSVRALREEALFLTADSFSRCRAGTCRPGRVRSR
jgi:hypothetical protein